MIKVDVVGLGYCSLDYLAVVDSYPVVDSKTEMADFVIDGGGPTATALVTLARLGAKTQFIGKVGDDSTGKMILGQLQKEGVDTGHTMVEKKSSSQLSLVIVESQTGKRTIIYTRGSVSQIKVAELDKDVVTSGAILHVDGHQMDASIVAAQWAREKGVMVVLDAGSVRPGMDALVALADYVVASKVFALDFTSETSIRRAARKLVLPHTRAVVVTAGEDGGTCICTEGEFDYPAFRVDVVDTTGAGDVFHGAFDYGILRGWDLRDVLQFASAVAALKCKGIGGRRGIPSFRDVEQLLGRRLDS